MRLFLFAVLGVTALITLPTHVVRADDVTGQLRSCRTIGDALMRAQCYDRIVDRLPSGAPAQPPAVPQAAVPQSSPPPTAPAQVARPAAPAAPSAPVVAKTPTERFGEKDLPVQKRVPEDELPPDVMVAKITGLRTDAGGYGTFTLDNGQVWRQVESSGLRFSNGARIKIRSGLMGVFYMSPENGNKSFRVKRVN